MVELQGGGDGAVEKDASPQLIHTLFKALNTLESLKDPTTSRTLILDTVNLLRSSFTYESFPRNDIKFVDIDVFSSILNAFSDYPAIKWDIVGIFFAYFCVFESLHDLLNEKSLKTIRSKLPKLEDNTAKEVDIFRVLQQVDLWDQEISIETLQFYDLQLGKRSISTWISLWEEYSKHVEFDPTMTLSPCKLSLYIAYTPELFENSSLYKQISLFPKWIEPTIYRTVIRYYIHDIDYKDVAFNLKVLMEIIDQNNNVNLLQESKMIFLLHLSLTNLLFPSNLKVTKLHQHLHQLGTTRTLLAILNIIQFKLSKFLLSLNSIPEKGALSLYIPSWFDDKILPSIPPISKSLFIFDTSNSFRNHTYMDNYELLMNCMNMNLILIRKLLLQYKMLDINLVSFDGIHAGSSDSIKFKNIQNYMELLFIPLLTTHYCTTTNNANTETLLDNKMMNQRIISSSIKVLETLVEYHGAMLLYHLIKFASQVSITDLKIQEICVDFLNHIFFHGNSDFVIKYCLENQLIKQALHDYVDLWNDGTETYTKFYDQILKEKQPTVEKLTVSLNDLIPDTLKCDFETMDNKHKNNSNHGDSDNPSPLQPIPQRAHTPSILPKAASKYNAYSSSSFVPSGKADTSSYTYPRNTLPSKNMTVRATTNNNDIQTSNNNNNNDSNARTAPTTPSTLLNPWAASPTISMTSSKMVSTGKNYILGGHSRIQNTSRAQSIHIDDFEDN